MRINLDNEDDVNFYIRGLCLAIGLYAKSGVLTNADVANSLRSLAIKLQAALQR